MIFGVPDEISQPLQSFRSSCENFAGAARIKSASAKVWQKLRKLDLLLPKLGRLCQNQTRLCQNLAASAKPRAASTNFWQALPKFGRSHQSLAESAKTNSASAKSGQKLNIVEKMRKLVGAGLVPAQSVCKTLIEINKFQH
jgi:hypothetical protein